MRTVKPATACHWTMLLALIAGAVFMGCPPAWAGESAFDLGFRNPLDDTELSWLPQPGATDYQLLRSSAETFSADCATFETSELLQRDPTEPSPGGVLHYLVRVLMPDPGSWGADSNGTAREVACMAPTGGLVSSSGCKELRDGFSSTRTRLTQDCIEWEYFAEGHLLLNHLNTAFNCCPEFEAGVDVEESTITVWEDETGGDCDCTCLFDLSYEVVNLDTGLYQVTVIQEYLYPEDERLNFPMDLESSPSGIHCVERDHYPW